jgi:hypothetical protein
MSLIYNGIIGYFVIRGTLFPTTGFIPKEGFIAGGFNKAPTDKTS